MECGECERCGDVPDMCVYVHACAATPLVLVQAMTQHGITAKLTNVEVIHMHTQGDAEYAQPHCKGRYLLMLSMGSVCDCLFCPYIKVNH